jgi:protein-S-isoprenylcysteine O-methyltransferase Ste14
MIIWSAKRGKRDLMETTPDMERIQRTRIIALRVVLLGFLLVISFHSTSWPLDSAVPNVVRLAGLLLLALAIGGRIWTRMHIGQRKRWHIVSDGPYAIVRHPLYMFSIIGAAGFGAQTGSLSMACASTVLTWCILDRTARIEEGDMTSRFGEAYTAYLACRRRFWPSLSLWTYPRVDLSIEPTLLRRTFLDSFWFAISPALFIALRLAQTMHVTPVLFRTP